jgi:methylmalonyl-CoA mutase N-terminal domain/subunit
VNKFTSDDDKAASIPLLKIDEAVQQKQIANLKAVKARRDAAKVKDALDAVRQAAQAGAGKANLMPPIIDAAKAYCTQQEWSSQWRICRRWNRLSRTSTSKGPVTPRLLRA